MECSPGSGEDIAGRSVLVTRAASGIGRALTLGLARDGAHVVGIERNDRGLSEIAGLGILTVTGDVTDSATLDAGDDPFSGV